MILLSPNARRFKIWEIEDFSSLCYGQIFFVLVDYIGEKFMGTFINLRRLDDEP